MADPSEKSLEMGMFLEQAYGRTSSISDNKCIKEPVGCERQITQDEMDTWDPLTRKEYSISGMCKTCQDEFYNQDDE